MLGCEWDETESWLLREMGSLDEPISIPLCNDAPFYFIGLSMAGWNGVASLVLAAVSFAAAAITFRTYQTK